MKNFNPKIFFLKSIFIYLILMLVMVFFSFIMFEPTAYKYMHQMFTAKQNASDNIALIVIDNQSIEQYRWPWKRELIAVIFKYLSEYSKPSVIGYDAVISSDDDKQSDMVLFNTLKNIDNLVVGFEALYGDSNDDDNKYIEKFNTKFATKVIDNRITQPTVKYNDLLKFPTDYFNSVKNVGSVNVIKDSGGHVFNADMLINVNGTLYPSLALKMYMQLNNQNQLTLNENSIEVNNIKIPVSNNYSAVQSKTNYYKFISNTGFSHKKYSASDIIKSYELLKKGQKPIINPEEFRDKIVFVGSNATATIALEDSLATPMSNEHPGIDIQATFLDNIINNHFVTSTTLIQDLLILICLSCLTFFLITKLSFFKSIIAIILLAILYVGISAMCFMNGIAVCVITPLTVQLITMIFTYSYNYIIEGKNKEKIQNVMGRYLSQDIMQNVVKDIDNVKLGGKKADLTVLFADIRGFTRISEQLSAEEVSMILNEYFTEIEPIITKYNGVINKFIGDAVMAIFGEPIHDINHAKNAVLCANEMLQAVERLRDKWLFEGKPKIEIGIGINTGEAFVGNIGSEKRLEYTVIGDMVNIASRIESYNKVYKTNFLISSSTYSHVSNIADVIKISEVSIRGKMKKMDIYEVLRLINWRN